MPRRNSNPNDAQRSSDWQTIAGWQVVVVSVLGGVAIYFGNSGDRWLPLLDSANLAFHETGHPLFGLLGTRLGVYGGTLMQLALPLLAAWSFGQRGDAPAGSVALIWLFENFFNIARYMADARAQMLPLVGSGDHDWNEIFARWHVLHLDRHIAGVTTALGVLGVLATCLGLARLWKRQQAARAPAQSLRRTSTTSAKR